MVAIARALDTSAKLLILDEPTSSLDTREVAELFTVMRRLRDEGLGIVFVTHFLDQVYAVCDRITVLRDGHLVGAFATAELPRLQLVSKMVGKDIAEIKHAVADAAPKQPGRSVVPLVERVNLADLVLPRGDGISRSTKAKSSGWPGCSDPGGPKGATAVGVDRADTGEVLLDGNRLPLQSPRDAIGRFPFTSENRKTEGIIPHLSVRENMILACCKARAAPGGLCC